MLGSVCRCSVNGIQSMETGPWHAVPITQAVRSGTLTPSTQHQIKTTKINGLKYEQNIKPPKATRFEDLVRFLQSKETKTSHEENLPSL